MTDAVPDTQDAHLDARLDQIEAALASLAEGTGGHAAWLGDLQRGVLDLVAAIRAAGEGAEPDAQRITASERAPAPASGLAAIEARAPALDVWAFMQWIEHAADVAHGPLVSVVTATIGRPQLRGAVRSVLDQSYPRLELIVVDDSAAGNAHELLGNLADERLRIVRTKARGVAAAYNTGLDAATGDIVGALDDDNVMGEHWLRSVVWAFDAFPDRGALYGARIVEDPAAPNGTRSRGLPAVQFSGYNRWRHERGNYIDRNAIAYRARHRDIRYDESLHAAVDWEYGLRLFAAAPPLALPALACYYRTRIADRISDSPEQPGEVRRVWARAHLHRPLRVHLHTRMFPVISETYIGEDLRALQAAGGVVTVSSLEAAVSVAEDAPPCRLDFDNALIEAEPDIVLMHWGFHAENELGTMERHEIPFASLFHFFDLDPERTEHLRTHPLCVALYAAPQYVRALPPGVIPVIPTIGPWTRIPDSPAQRSLVLSASAGVRKKMFPMLIDALAQVPEHERMIIVARSNGLEELPDEVMALARERDPAIQVRINVQRPGVLGAMARASVFIYTLRDDLPMGIPMSVIEALLCGAIVIAPDREEAHDMVGEHLRPYRTPDDIVRHIREVMRGGPAVEEAREALRQRAQRYRDPAALRFLHDSLRDQLTAWKLRR